jgi:hypothetical protein
MGSSVVCYANHPTKKFQFHQRQNKPSFFFKHRAFALDAAARSCSSGRKNAFDGNLAVEAAIMA